MSEEGSTHPDLPFDDDEYLYRRICAEDLLPDGTIAPDSLDLPGPSFNRSSLSQPGDVLDSDSPEYNGVARIRVGDIPRGTIAQGSHRYEAIWDPKDDNEAHTEVRLIRDKDGVCHKPGGSSHKLELREKLAAHMEVIIQPTQPKAVD